ncbi:MAG TPA: hypothetical protein VF711_14070 [Acidimicrobiales bacterium]
MLRTADGGAVDPKMSEVCCRIPGATGTSGGTAVVAGCATRATGLGV